MNSPIKIILPTAGWATRMRPQTWSKPKPLVSVAGRTALDHLLASFRSLPFVEDSQVVIIYSPGLGETQIPPFMQENYPQVKASFVLQPVMKGQSDALWLARSFLDGPLIICFSDTLIETDFSFLAVDEPEAVAWVKSVPDPRRFGVAEIDQEGWVTRLVEKPTSLENNRVVVGCYYLREGRDLLSAIEEQVRRDTSRKGEFFLTDALNIMLERGLKMRTVSVDVWLDTGTIDATLETNRHLLNRLGGGQPYGWDEQTCRRAGVTLIPPVYIHPSTFIQNSTIGPHVSIAADCRLMDAHVEDSILEAGVVIQSASLGGSFIGRHARIVGRSSTGLRLTLNIGDNSSVNLE